MPFFGSTTGTIGYKIGVGLVGAPVWTTAEGSLGTLNDTQRANTFTVIATSGPGAISHTYAVQAGSLPAGASLNSGTGVISGFSPVSSNTTSSFTIRATNNAGIFTDRTFEITINAATVSWTTAAGALTQGTRTQSYSVTVSATASTGTISYSVVSGSLPNGLSLNSSNGVISGTPSVTNNFSFTIRATTTSASVSADRAFSINIVNPIVDLINSSVFQGIRDYLAARNSRYVNPGFYNYSLDSPPGRISDGGGDMFDGGNDTHLYQSGGQQANSVAYNTSNSTAGNLRWGGLGYDRALTVMATSGRTNRRYGWGTNGNLGADGGGSATTQTVYNTQTVNGCLVHAWVSNKSYNRGDPSVNHLYVTLGHASGLGSSINSFDVASASGNPDNDYSQYETTSNNCCVFHILLSRPSGSIVNVGDCQAAISNLIVDFKAHFGF